MCSQIHREKATSEQEEKIEDKEWILPVRLILKTDDPKIKCIEPQFKDVRIQQQEIVVCVHLDQVTVKWQQAYALPLSY